jgi:hypothetical protein
MTDAPKTPRPPFYFDVPMGTPCVPCKGSSCNVSVFWIRTPKNRPMPVDCTAPDCYPPTSTTSGRGISHFGTCVDAAKFRKAR